MQTSIVFLFLSSKIKEFYNKNSARIRRIKQDREDLWNEYLVVENGQVQFEEVDGQMRSKMKEEIRRKEFEDKMSALMLKQISIEI